MIELINGDTGMPVKVPEQFVDRFLAAGFRRPAAPEPVTPAAEKPAPRRRRTTKPAD